MIAYLALTPNELREVKGQRLPLVHIAYAIGEHGLLLRSELPSTVRGGLMGLSDHCPSPLPNAAALCRSIVTECNVRRFGGVVADFEGMAQSDRCAFLTQLGELLARNGRRLYVPEGFDVPNACTMVCTAVSGGTLGELLTNSVARYGASGLALDCQRLAMDFTIPNHRGEGTPLTREELAALRERCGASVFYSGELGANYFSYHDGKRAHFVLFDTAQTLRRKVELGAQHGAQAAFFMYPEVSDIVSELFPVGGKG